MFNKSTFPSNKPKSSYDCGIISEESNLTLADKLSTKFSLEQNHEISSSQENLFYLKVVVKYLKKQRKNSFAVLRISLIAYQ